MTMPEDTARRPGAIGPPLATKEARLEAALRQQGDTYRTRIREQQALIDALTAERDAPPTRCGNCGGDLRPVCVACGTRHGYGWPDLPEPTPEVCEFCGSGGEDAPYVQNCPHPHG